MAKQVPNTYGGTIRPGRIVDVNPWNNEYRVDIVGIPDVIPCFGGGLASYSPSDSQNLHTFSPQTFVLVFLPPNWQVSGGFILCAIPHPQPYGSDIIFPSVMHYAWPPLPQYNQFSEHWRGGTLQEATPGQEGVAFATGLQFSINMFEAILKAGEKAGLEVNLIDNHLKLLGFNYTLMSSGGIDKRIGEYGEYNDICMATPYLWEAKSGAFERQFQPAIVGGRPYTPTWPIGNSPTIPRHVIVKGYQGDLVHEFIQVPNIYHDFVQEGRTHPTGIASYSDGVRVFDEIKGIDGYYHLLSAKEILIGKTGLLTPFKIARNDTEYSYDPDNPELTINYYPAGMRFTDWAGSQGYYSLPGTVADADLRYFYTHKEASINGADAGLLTSSVTDTYGAAALDGLLAYSETSHRWLEHTRSLVNHPMWEEGSQPTISVTDDDLGGWFQVDHRSWVRYNPSTSFFYMAEDGSITLQAGNNSTGSKIVLHPTEGIQISGPTITSMSDYHNVGAGNVHITANNHLQMASDSVTELWSPKNVIVENLVRGRLSAVRTALPTTVDIQLWGNACDGTGWVLALAYESQPNDGSYAMDVSEVAGFSSKVWKVRVAWYNEGVGEYLDSDFFFQGGGGASSQAPVLFSVDGEAYKHTAAIPDTAKITSLHYSGYDEDGNLRIAIETGCYKLS